MKNLNNTPYGIDTEMAANTDVYASLGSMSIEIRDLRRKQKRDRRQIAELTSIIGDMEERSEQLEEMLSRILLVVKESEQRWTKKYKKEFNFGALIAKALPALCGFASVLFNRFTPDTRVLTAREQKRYLGDGR